MTHVLQRSLELLEARGARSDDQRKAIFAKLRGKSAFRQKTDYFTGEPTLKNKRVSWSAFSDSPSDIKKAKLELNTRGSKLREFLARLIRKARSSLGFSDSMQNEDPKTRKEARKMMTKPGARIVQTAKSTSGKTAGQMVRLEKTRSRSGKLKVRVYPDSRDA